MPYVGDAGDVGDGGPLLLYPCDVCRCHVVAATLRARFCRGVTQLVCADVVACYGRTGARVRAQGRRTEAMPPPDASPGAQPRKSP